MGTSQRYKLNLRLFVERTRLYGYVVRWRSPSSERFYCVQCLRLLDRPRYWMRVMRMRAPTPVNYSDQPEEIPNTFTVQISDTQRYCSDCLCRTEQNAWRSRTRIE